MSSIVEFGDGKRRQRRIDFMAPHLKGADGQPKRCHIGLGSCARSDAVAFQGWLDKLSAARRLASGERAAAPTDDKLAAWVSGLGDDLYAKLVRADLVPPRGPAPLKSTAPKLSVFVAKFIEQIGPKVKPNSLRLLKQTQAKLAEYFTGDPAIDAITRDHAADWSAWLKAHKTLNKKGKEVTVELADATVRLHVRHAKWMFGDGEFGAVGRELIARDPFAKLASAAVADDRRVYITAEMADKVMAELPGIEWRALFALARFAGLRSPSETHGVTWKDVDWDRKRLSVYAPKADRKSRRSKRADPVRVIPILPRLHEILREAFEAAPERATTIVPIPRTASYRHVIEPAIKRAGYVVWPKLFHMLRKSFGTDIEQRFGVHAAATWMGNTPEVAHGHYFMVPDATFDQACAAPAATQHLAQQQSPAPPVTTGHSAESAESASGSASPDKAKACAHASGDSELVANGPARIRTGDQAIMSRLL